MAHGLTDCAQYPFYRAQSPFYHAKQPAVASNEACQSTRSQCTLLTLKPFFAIMYFVLSLVSYLAKVTEISCFKGTDMLQYFSKRTQYAAIFF